MAVEDPQLSRRERKAERTRRDIVRAASELVLADGYERATITRIAERADLATRTVTTRFASKEEIFFEGTEALVTRAEHHLRSTAGDVVDRLQAWIDEVSEQATGTDHDPEIRALRTRAIASDPDLQALRIQHFNRAHTAIAEAVARDTGQAPDAPGPQMIAAAAIALLGAVERTAVSQPPEETPRALTDGFHVLRAALHALGD
jgi:AcrR family transcriptional regulator